MSPFKVSSILKTSRLSQRNDERERINMINHCKDLRVVGENKREYEWVREAGGCIDEKNQYN